MSPSLYDISGNFLLVYQNYTWHIILNILVLFSLYFSIHINHYNSTLMGLWVVFINSNMIFVSKLQWISITSGVNNTCFFMWTPCFVFSVFFLNSFLSQYIFFSSLWSNLYYFQMNSTTFVHWVFACLIVISHILGKHSTPKPFIQQNKKSTVWNIVPHISYFSFGIFKASCSRIAGV